MLDMRLTMNVGGNVMPSVEAIKRGGEELKRKRRRCARWYSE